MFYTKAIKLIQAQCIKEGVGGGGTNIFLNLTIHKSELSNMDPPPQKKKLEIEVIYTGTERPPPRPGLEFSQFLKRCNF